MAVRKQSSGKWLCECYPAGRKGSRVRKQFATKGEALAFERFIMEEVTNKPWLGVPPDRRRLSDLIETWYRAYGITLAGGERRYKKYLPHVLIWITPILLRFQQSCFLTTENAG